MFQFQLYFHFLMYHFYHVLNHHYHVLLCYIYHEFAVQVFVDFVGVESHQHQCLIQNLFLTCLKM